MPPEYDKYHDLREKLGIDQMDEQTRKKMLEKLKKAGGKVDFSIFDKHDSTASTGIFKRKNQKEKDYDLIDGYPKRKIDGKKVLENKRLENLKKFKTIEKKLEIEKSIVKKDKLGNSPITTSRKNKIKDQLSSTLDKDRYSRIRTESTENIDKENASKREFKRDIHLSLVDRILFVINGQIFKTLSYKSSKFHHDFLVYFFPLFASTISKLGYFVKACFNNYTIKKKIRETLSKLSTMHYEILHQFLNIADENYLSEFYEKSFDDFDAILNEAEFSRFSFFFKKLLFLKDNSGVFEISLLTSRNIYLQFYRLNLSEQEIINDISFLITTAYEKLHIVFCRNIGKYLSFNSHLIKEYLKYDETDNLGYYIQKEKKEEEARLAALKNKFEDNKKAIEEDIEAKEIAKIPDDVKKGFEFMDEIQNTFEKHKDEIMQNDIILQRLNPEDKIALVYIFYKELNEQYSIFMTLKDVIYKIKYEEHKKVDVKAELNDVLNEMNLLYQEFEQYAALSLKVRIKSEDTFYDDTLTKDKENLVKLSVSIRNKLIEILQSFLILTMKLIKDYADKTFYIIDNPEEKLFVDEKLHGIKKFNGKPIIYIYTRVYYFIKAFIYRLERTDLSGIKLNVGE